MKHSLHIKIILFFSLLGLGISVYSLLHTVGLTSGEFCSLNETINCDVVNKGPYSTIFGIPVALIGVLGYVFLAMAAGMKMRQPDDRQLAYFLIIASTGGLMFSLYLTSLEAFVLHTWCALCVTSQLIMLTIFLLSLTLVHKTSESCHV